MTNLLQKGISEFLIALLYGLELHFFFRTYAVESRLILLNRNIFRSGNEYAKSLRKEHVLFTHFLFKWFLKWFPINQNNHTNPSITESIINAIGTMYYFKCKLYHANLEFCIVIQTLGRAVQCMDVVPLTQNEPLIAFYLFAAAHYTGCDRCTCAKHTSSGPDYRDRLRNSTTHA